MLTFGIRFRKIIPLIASWFAFYTVQRYDKNTYFRLTKYTLRLTAFCSIIPFLSNKTQNFILLRYSCTFTRSHAYNEHTVGKGKRKTFLHKWRDPSVVVSLYRNSNLKQKIGFLQFIGLAMSLYWFPRHYYLFWKNLFDTDLILWETSSYFVPQTIFPYFIFFDREVKL